MKLYHFTKPEFLLGIAMSGLEPQIYDEVPHLTMGQPVVWLTTEETLKPSEDDVAFMREHRAEDFARFMDTLLPGRDLRLTVNLDPRANRKKLFHYHTWMHETPIRMSWEDDDGTRFDELKPLSGSDVLRDMPGGLLPSSRHWWIYLGTIKPSRIEINPTAGRMLPSIQYNLAAAIEEGNADRIASLREMRAKVLSVEPDRLLQFDPVA